MDDIVTRFATLRGRGWTYDTGHLRCAKGYCPIIALADQEGGVGFEHELDSNMPWASITTRLNSAYRRIGQDLGLSDRMITAIVNVADNAATHLAVRISCEDPDLRAELKAIFEVLQ